MSINRQDNYVMKARYPIPVALIEYLWALSVVLEGNSVYRHTVEINYHLTMFCMVLSVILFLIKCRMRIQKQYMTNGLILFAYMAVYYGIRFSEVSSEIYISTMLIGLPVMLMLFDLYASDGELFRPFECLSNVVLIIAVLSTVTWLLGTVLGILPLNTSIRINWGMDKVISGYFGLQYDVARDTTFGVTFYRNQGIFTEAPMLSLWASIALANELFLRKTLSKLRVAILITCIVSTVSTTGLIFIVLSAILYYFEAIATGSTVRKILLVALMIIFIPAVYYVLQTIYSYKMSTVSFVMRSQDYLVGFNVFRETPLFGSGFGNLSTIITTTFNGARGYSNSVMALLATGGIWFMLVFLISLVGYYRPRSKGERMRTRKIGICYLFLYISTIFFARFIAVVFFAFGLSLLTATGEELSEGVDY